MAPGPRTQGLVERLAARGVAAQTTQGAVAGAYAWAVTVAPVFWEPSVSVIAEVAAAVALSALLAGTLAERRWGRAARIASHWAFVLASALAWLAAPGTVASARVDGPRGLAGMLGWALFALTSAGPALGEPREPGRLVADGPLEARRTLAPGDAAYLVGGGVVALGLQVVGWKTAAPERALLVRLVALAAGLAVIGAAAEMSLARHAARAPRPIRARWRRARAALALLCVLALGGLLLAARD